MLNDFLHTHKIGLIVRVSGSTEEIAQRRLGYLKHLLRAFPRKIHTVPLLTQVNLVVLENPVYADFSDIGTTYDRLTNLASPHCTLVLQRVTEGDLACTALNQAIENQRQAGITHSFIWSCEAFSYVHKKTLERMLRAAQCGARAVGVILHEYDQLQRELAWPMNTAVLWELNSLLKEGGFDLRAQLPPEQYGSASTAEEVLPAINLVKRWGRCITLVPAEKGAGYIAPHPELHADEAERHEAKFSTKKIRFAKLAALESVKASFLRDQGLQAPTSTDP